MEAVYVWIRNITGYTLFMMVLDNLLPGKKYGKYIKLFSGMILILLVIQPLTGSIHLDDTIARYYEAFVFQYEADDLRQELLGMEDTRMNQMIAKYEAAVAEDIRQMAEEEGFGVISCQIIIESDSEAADFGAVRKTSLRVTLAQPPPAPPVGPVDPVKPVTVGTTIAPVVEPEAEAEERPAVGQLRKKIVSYYGLEESNVEIQIMESQR